jgi:hypothetical protein
MNATTDIIDIVCLMRNKLADILSHLAPSYFEKQLHIGRLLFSKQVPCPEHVSLAQTLTLS